MAKVFVINKGGHDYRAAEEYGEIVYLSRGYISPFSTNRMFRMFDDLLKDSQPEDYILITSLTSMCCIAACIMTAKHGKVNFLLFKNDRYIKRSMRFDDDEESEE